MTAISDQVLARAAVAEVPARDAWQYRSLKRTFSAVLAVDPVWEVFVRGLPPHDEFRIYYIEAQTDGKAAMEGIRRFVAEFERPRRATSEI